MKNDLQSLPGLGGRGPVSESEYQSIKSGLATLVNDFHETKVSDSAAYEQNTRYCVWDGQSADGRKHGEDLGTDAFPFEGAPDNRIRLADGVVNFCTAVKMAAASRASVALHAMESNDSAYAADMGNVIRWVRGRLGSMYRRQLKLVASWSEADNPAAAVMYVGWEEEKELVPTTVTLETIAAQLAMLEAEDEVTFENATRDYIDMFLDEEREVTAVATLQAWREGLTDREARSFLERLRPPVTDDDDPTGERRQVEDFPEVEFPMPRRVTNAPMVEAMKLGHDIFIPRNCRDLQRAHRIYTRKLYSRSEMERLMQDPDRGWDRKVVKEFLGTGRDGDSGRQGKSALPYIDYTSDSHSEVSHRRSEDPVEDLYEVFTVWFKATNREGATGIYKVDFCPDMDKPFGPRRLSTAAHGRMPFVYFSREVTDHELVESRGTPELLTADQSQVKIMVDSFGAHVQLKTLPPLRTPLNRGGITVTLAPLRQIPEIRQNEIGTFDIGEYPRSAVDMIKMTMARVYEYHGYPGEGVSEQVAQVLMQEMVDQFLTSYADVLYLLVQECQQHLTDEELFGIIGRETGMRRDRAGIQGRFDLSISWNAQEMDPEYVVKLLGTIVNLILPIDKDSSVDTGELVLRAFNMIDPNLAAAVVRPVADAARREQSEEEMNWIKIQNGIPVQPQEVGQNHQLRLEVLGGLAQMNQQSVMQWPPERQLMLQERMKHLQLMVDQRENAVIGRVGANPATAAQAAKQVMGAGQGGGR